MASRVWVRTRFPTCLAGCLCRNHSWGQQQLPQLLKADACINLRKHVAADKWIDELVDVNKQVPWTQRMWVVHQVAPAELIPLDCGAILKAAMGSDSLGDNVGKHV